MKLRIAYTPDADDAYMLHALLEGKIAGPISFEPVEARLSVLNDAASRGEYDITMFSAAAWPMVRKHYQLARAGSSFAQKLGPVIVAAEPFEPAELTEKSIAIPGATTTAYSMLELYKPGLRTQMLPLGKLLPAVQAGLVDCALVIHEEFLAYDGLGLCAILDLGKWWRETTGGLPMPVTCCGISRDLPAETATLLADMLAESARYARTHHDQALASASKYHYQADAAQLDAFVRDYVSDLTEEMGPSGEAALEHFFSLTSEQDLLPAALPLEFV